MNPIDRLHETLMGILPQEARQGATYLSDCIRKLVRMWDEQADRALADAVAAFMILAGWVG